MTYFNYRILGYNHDFGVVRIEGNNVASRDVVIFASQGIAAHTRLNIEEVLFISAKGEVAKLNLGTTSFTKREKLFSTYQRTNKLLQTCDGQSVISLTNSSITVINSVSLKVLKSYNAVLQDEGGVLRLKDYEDIKEPFEAKASAEHERFLKVKKANPKGPWPKREWSWATSLSRWPINSGNIFRPEFRHQTASIRNNVIIAPYDIKRALLAKREDTQKGTGLVRMNLRDETIAYEDLSGFDSAIPHHMTIKTISDDGKGFLADRHHVTRLETTAAKPKRLFGLGRRQVELEFQHHLEVWRIEKSATLDHHISMGSIKPILYPEHPSKETKLKHPTLYKSRAKEALIDECRLEAAKLQYRSVFETMNWSEEKFKSDFSLSLSKKNVELDQTLTRQLERLQNMHFAARPFMVDNFLDFALKENANFIQEWQTKSLDDVQQKTLGSIKLSLKRLTQRAVAFEWKSIEDDIHILEKMGTLRHISTQGEMSNSHAIEGLAKGLGDQSNHSLPRIDGSGLFVENTMKYGRIKDGLIINLPLRTEFRGEESIIPTQRVYDADSFKQDHDISEKLARKSRRGYVTIPSKSPANLLTGLAKLTQEYAKHHEDIVLSNRWDAGLFHGKSLILESEIAKILTNAKDSSAIPVLMNFVKTVMQVSLKDGVTISPYPRDQNMGHVHWRVWHNDNFAQVGMPSVNAIIALSETIPELALTYYRYRDFEHDVYTEENGLPNDVLPYVELDKPGVLKLLAITAFQFLATGRVENDLFAQHGMDRVATALENGQLSAKLAAQIFVDEVKGLEGELSWGDNLGPHGLVAQAVYGLDKSSPSKVAFGEEILRIYPEAQDFLTEKMTD
jgi:HAMP domain-containing protein